MAKRTLKRLKDASAVKNGKNYKLIISRIHATNSNEDGDIYKFDTPPSPYLHKLISEVKGHKMLLKKGTEETKERIVKRVERKKNNY